MSAKIKTISYADLVSTLLANLPDRERQVLQKRNALADNANIYTLEQIGKDFNITRERVRQIEKEGLRKIKVSLDSNTKSPINDLHNVVSNNLQNHGGFLAENHLKENLLNDNSTPEANALDFILVNILAEKFNRQSDLEDYNVIWHIDDINLQEFIELAETLKSFIEQNKQPLTITELLDKFKTHQDYEKIEKHLVDNDVLTEALLRLRKDVNRNILDQWGIHDWSTIKPKRMTDKAYLIMLREKRPLHFSEVADLINQASFDQKKACPATVHNELILDDKYVLVGRGIYALKQWGYQVGTVNDIINAILKDSDPLSKKQIIEEVLKQRLVQKTTIILALMNKDKFERLEDGNYRLVK